MSKRYNEKRKKLAEAAIERELDSGYGAVDTDALAAQDVRDAALGKGEEELFEKKLSKEEKKARAKAAREAKKKAKGKTTKKTDEDSEEKAGESNGGTGIDLLDIDEKKRDELKKDEALEWLNQQNINVTYEARKAALHANARDINVSGVTVTFHGKPLIEDTDLVINYGNRYGFIGPNGSGKSTIMKAIAARAVPIPGALDIYFLDSEYPARDDITALEAVMESNDEVALLEQKAEQLNNKMAEVEEEEQIAIQAQLEGIYSRLDQLDAASAEARATTILHGLGFTKTMQGMTTREFSGGWRMRVALARALFLQPEFLLLDGKLSHRARVLQNKMLDHLSHTSTAIHRAYKSPRYGKNEKIKESLTEKSTLFPLTRLCRLLTYDHTGCSSVARGISFELDEDSLFCLSQPGIHEQCLHSYCPSGYDVQEAALLHWQL